MRVPSARSVFSLGLGFLGLAVSIWLAVFFDDAKRPVTPREQAELLAAENYRHFSFSAPLPPSPRHWEQLFVLIDDGRRVPLANDATALLLALTGGHRAGAGVLAFGFMSAMFGWLTTRGGNAPRGTLFCVLLTGMAIAQAWAWQLVDPAPFIVAGFGALFVGAWLGRRSGLDRSWPLGAGMAGLALSAMPLAIIAALAVLIDVVLSSQAAHARPPGAMTISRPKRLWPVLVLPLVVLAFFGMKNVATTGKLFVTPTAAYQEKNSIAPVWLWEPIGVPPPNVDPVIERHDQLVSLPASRWPTPVYQAWTARIIRGVRSGAGVAVAIAAVAGAITLCPARKLRPILVLGSLLLCLSLLRYSFQPEWWCLLGPIFLWTLIESIRNWRDASRRRRTVAAVVLGLGQVVSLAWSPQNKPTAAEYGFKLRTKEILDHLAKKPGKHLVFASYDTTADARLDASCAPRDWARASVLFTRDLDHAQNAALAAAMPDRTVWRAIVYSNRVGLLDWTPSAPGVPTDSATSAETTPTAAANTHEATPPPPQSSSSAINATH